MNIFVGNLLFEATENDVRKLFEGFGVVAEVTIVMEKKGDKSRGFGFVEMPDTEQAQSAIAALDSKDFMGRILNVSPARPKSEEEEKKIERKKVQPHAEAEPMGYPRKIKGQERGRPNPAFSKAGGYSRYKEGRRSRNFMARRSPGGTEARAAGEHKSKGNPMRWRKNYSQDKPWQKKEGQELKPWRKFDGQSKPWQKNAGVEFKPWRKSGAGGGETKPWQASAGDAKPRRKSFGSKPWQKRSAGASKPAFRARKRAGSFNKK
jgi:RNA recognition motif-containing protein